MSGTSYSNHEKHHDHKIDAAQVGNTAEKIAGTHAKDKVNTRIGRFSANIGILAAAGHKTSLWTDNAPLVLLTD